MFKHGHIVSLSLVNVMLTTVLSVETTSWSNMTTTAFLDDGRNYDHPNFTWPPTPMPTTSSLYSPTQQPIHCDRDHNCTNSPTEQPIIQPSVMPTEVPETGNDDSSSSSTSISPSISTTGDNEANMSDSESYAWNDPIVLAVGLLGVLVLLLTGMVSIFACMAYTKSKENMRIADKLRVSMMNDNSHSNENDKQEGRRHDHNNKNNNNNRGQTDYRNVASTDMFLPENENNNHKLQQQNRGAGPGSVDDDHLLAIDVASGMDSGASPVVVEMNQRSNYNNNNNGERGGGGGGNNNEQDAGFIDDDNDNRQYGSYVTPAGIEHISTDAVIASVQDEGAGSGYNKGGGGAAAPQLEHVASQTKDSNSHSHDNNNNNNDNYNNDNEQSSNVIAGSISSMHNGGNKESFLQGLNNVAAGNLAAEDDVIQHMATAGGDDGNDENNDNNNVDDDDIQLAFE